MPLTPDEFERALAECRETTARVAAEIGKVVIGQRGAVRLVLAAMLARSHCLLVGVPGLAKTLL
ncbi:MAG: AAA family ATPase, partial [Planctomycetota bacterium]